MKEKFAKFKNGFVNNLKCLLNSKFFPFITAAVTLLCYYLALDIVFIYYISITGILILLLLDDVTPVIANLLFMGVAVSYQHSPSIKVDAPSDYFARTEILALMIIALSLFAVAAGYRIVLSFIRKQVKPEPALFGLCAFSLVLILNGVFSADYSPKNLLYGFALALSFLVIYVGIKANIKISREAFEKIALAFIALSALLLIELFVKYLTANVYSDGKFDREKLSFGWGVWNTIGMMLVLCIPAPVFLAGRKKYGFLYTLYSVVLFVACILSCSRQAMVAAIIIYPICLLILLIKGKNRIPNICIIGAAFAAGVILLAVKWDTLFAYFVNLFRNLFKDGELNGNGRVELWKDAIEYFKCAPLFGVGFYVDFANDPGFSGMSFIPLMSHNTIFQLLSACGLFGLLTYTIHRIQTLVSFFKNITVERAFIGLTILGILITSLFDNHIFYIFPTFIYSSLLAVLIKSQKKEA